MAYDRKWSVQYPGLLILLLDQSESMRVEPWGLDETRTKAEGLAEAVNTLLLELIVQCVTEADGAPSVRPRLDVSILGYGPGGEVRPAFGGALAGRRMVSIAELADNPLRAETAYWLDAVGDGPTPMGEAFEEAIQVAAPWANEHPSSFPPVVINVTDGAYTGVDPAPAVEDLQRLRTHDGNLVLINVNLSQYPTPPPIVFPATKADLDSYSQLLFDWSSPLPQPNLQRAQEEIDPGLTEGARAFAFNPDFRLLSKILLIGSTVVGGGAGAPGGADRGTTR